MTEFNLNLSDVRWKDKRLHTLTDKERGQYAVKIPSDRH